MYSPFQISAFRNSYNFSDGRGALFGRQQRKGDPVSPTQTVGHTGLGLIARHLVSTNSIYSMVQFKILPLSLKALYQKTGRDVPPHCKRCFRRSRHRMGGMKIPMTVTVVVMGILFTTTHGILLHLLFGI